MSVGELGRRRRRNPGGRVVVLGAIDAAGMLLGAAVAVLEHKGGPILAVRDLRELADEIEGVGQERSAPPN